MGDVEVNTKLRGHNPLLGIDIERLEQEMESYQNWLDERADEHHSARSVRVN